MQESNCIRKIFIRKSIVTLFSGVTMLLFSCENDIQKIKEFADLQNQPSVVSEGFEMIYSDSTVIRYKLNTPKLVLQENTEIPYIEYPEGVHIEKYDVRMNITASIRSNYAKYYTKEERWEAKNNVVAVNASGDTLKTEQLLWDENKGKIYSDEFVKIIRADQIMTGIGLEANQDFSNWKIKNPKGTIYVEVNEGEQ
ncbi:MAG: LPS export ABC transporter periplasmic protein LptC [Prolixibacteraceae bacterium]|nr:LPS export ABC transporter periplasmic protein LptC [Prolixibacteraceae bacterium]